MMMHRWISVVMKCCAAAWLCGVVACSTNRNEWGEMTRIPGSSWHVNEPVRIALPVTDSLSAYSLSVHVRHNSAYRYANMWVFVSVYTPDGVLWRKDTVDLALASADGRWLGKGWGDLYAVEAPLGAGRTVFPVCGTWRFSVEQGMREQSLRGVHDVGLRMVKNRP